MGRMLGPERLRKALETLKGSIASAVSRMPTHKDSCSRIAGPRTTDVTHPSRHARWSDAANDAKLRPCHTTRDALA
jgi:hypothetical protein